GLAGTLVLVAAGDLLERLAAAGHTEPDGARKVGVEHQESDDADGLDAVALRAEVGPVRRAAPQESGPEDELHPGLGAGCLLPEAPALGVEDPAGDVHSLQVAAEPEEVVDLVARQRVVDQAVPEEARLLDRGVEAGRAGVEPLLGAPTAEVE